MITTTWLTYDPREPYLVRLSSNRNPPTSDKHCHCHFYIYLGGYVYLRLSWRLRFSCHMIHCLPACRLSVLHNYQQASFHETWWRKTPLQSGADPGLLIVLPLTLQKQVFFHICQPWMRSETTLWVPF